MKAIIQGKPFAAALESIHKAAPDVDRLVIHANGKLEVVGYSAHSFQGAHATIETGEGYENIIDGTVAIERFDILWQLSRMAEFRTAELTLSTNKFRTEADIETRYEQKLVHNGRKYTDTVPAEYRLATFDVGMDVEQLIATIDKVAEAQTAAAAEVATIHALPEPTEVPVKSVTIQGLYLKTFLPRTKHGTVTIASTSQGVRFIVDSYAAKAWHFTGDAQADRFFMRVPLGLLRKAVAAGDTVTIGYLRTECKWNEPKPDYYEHRHPYRKPACFVETRIGTVNGIPFAEQRVFINTYDRERNAKTCKPVRYAIGYRDERSLYDRTIYSEWHFIREIVMPEYFAERALAKMQATSPRELALVPRYSDDPIALESDIIPHAQWQAKRVWRRAGKQFAKRYRGYCRADVDEYEVNVTVPYAMMTPNDSRKTYRDGTDNIHLGNFPDAAAKALTRPENWDLAQDMLNGIITRRQLEDALDLRTAAPAKKVRTRKVRPAEAAAPIVLAMSTRISYRAEATPMLEIEGL